MNFNQWFFNLQTHTAQNAGVGLVAFKRLLNRLDNPQDTYKIIHVAGTNGKGTVCTLLAHTLTCAGHQTGLFVSPHLVSPTERIQLNGQQISEDDFISCVQTVLDAQQEPLNFFELLTAAALLYFAKQNAQYVVLETGLGGRKDPTNVCNPVLSIITSVGLDHMHLLGHTLTQISTEKAGIIKPGVPVLCGPLQDEAAYVIEQTILENHAPLTWVQEGQPFYAYAYDFVNGFTTMHTADRQEWELHLLGEQQTQNACLVYHAARRLGVEENAIRTAFESVQLPGRFERIKKGNTTFILDGAHNLPAAESLLKFWQKTPYHLQQPTLLCGFMKDKDFKQMLNLFAPHFARVIVTVPPSVRGAAPCVIPQEPAPQGCSAGYKGRGATAQDFGNLLNDPHITLEPDYQAALTLAQQAPVVLCMGSFYLAGAVRESLLEG